MAFTTRPEESKKAINKAAQSLLSRDAANGDERREALNLVNRWRACHAYPINTFQATLRSKLRIYAGEPIVAQRLKRLPTILDKLRRYPQMQLTTMQDIGGVRAILESIADVEKLTHEYRDSSRFSHKLVNEKDYISSPRNEDGYRGVHLIYRYDNDRAPAYNGLLVELQVRTRLEHTWATAVETMGTLLGQALKSRQGDRDWLEFFAITSSAFAWIEGTQRVPRFSHLSKSDTFGYVAEAEAKLGALEKMHNLSAVVQGISEQEKSYFYHLIVLDSINKRVDVKPYTRASFTKASADYAEVERRAVEGEMVEPVLVSAGPLKALRSAYPNFFLDIHDFADAVRNIIEKYRVTAEHEMAETKQRIQITP